MRLPVKHQTQFLLWQIKEHEDVFRSYLRTPMHQHFKNKTAFAGKIWGIDEQRGSLIIRFPLGLAPRLNQPYDGFVYGGVGKKEDLSSWDFSYEYFRTVYARGNTGCKPVFFLPNDDKSARFIGFKEVDASFASRIKTILAEGKKPSIVLAEKDPPVKYLFNLRDFTESYPNDSVLNMNFLKDIDDWLPDFLNGTNNKKETICNYLKNNDEIIIQGPPGTGKSHLVAEIAAEYIAVGKKVCVTTLTNKALMEVAEKPALKDAMSKSKAFKTNLTFEELKKMSNLSKPDKLTLGEGEILFSTYYVLSSWFGKETNAAQQSILPVYDLMIIEEASQAFLATIAAFKKLAEKVLIVGDPLQLPPIILNEHSASSIHPEIMRFARGLEAYAANAGSKAYMLAETHRLSQSATELTGIFYRNQLSSVASDFKKVITSERFNNLIPSDGGVKLHYMPLIPEGVFPKQAVELVAILVEDILEKNPDLEISVLAPFRATVLLLQDRLGKNLDDFSRLTVETIDRIQGLTTDFTIYLLALSNPSFALDTNRFNVATSRAKSGTLIITDENFIYFRGIDPRVTKFLTSLNK